MLWKTVRILCAAAWAIRLWSVRGRVRTPPFYAMKRSSNPLCCSLRNQAVERGFDAGFKPRRSTSMTPQWWVQFPCSCYQWQSGSGSLEHYIASTVDAVMYFYRLIVSFVCCGCLETGVFNFSNCNNNNNHNQKQKASITPNLWYNKYCWSHGINPTHDNCGCRNKLPSHQDTTIYTNQMGRWQTNAPQWCGFVVPWVLGRSESKIESLTNKIV